MPNGKGTIRQPDGGVYQGDFVDDQAHGKGKYVSGDGKIIY
mgnify:CR=1 FL=1